MSRIAHRCLLVALALALAPARAADAGSVEEAGVGVGLTAGNLWFVPIKAISVTWGLVAGGLDYCLTGGDAERARQIWQDTSQGPYLITPDIARVAVGTRPELLED